MFLRAPAALVKVLMSTSLLSLFTAAAQAVSFVDGPQSTMYVDGPVAENQLHIFNVTLWVTLIIFIIVGGVLAWATIKFKARSQADEHAAPPPQGHGNPLIEMGLIVVSILALVIIAVPTLKGIWFTHRVPPEYQANLFHVKAIGYQWWFKFEYTDHKAKYLDAADNSVRETLLNTANELVVPVGRPVRVELRTVDVIHSFWIPKLAGKVDMIPNRGNFLWFQADKAGFYWGQCAEYCGESHGLMRFRVIALDPADFDKWLANQSALARTAPADASAPTKPINLGKYEGAQLAYGKFTPGNLTHHEGDDLFEVWKKLQLTPAAENAALIQKGRQFFAQKTCNACHTVKGHAAGDGAYDRGPNLTHVGARVTIAAGLLDNTPENLKHWLMHPNNIKPGNKMFNGGYREKDGHTWKEKFSVNSEEADALVAYLHSLK